MQLEEKVRVLETQLKQEQEENRQLLAAEKEKLLFHTRQKEFFFAVMQLLQLKEDFSKILDAVLAKIGEHTKVDRIKVWERNPDGVSYGVSYEWCEKGVKPSIHLLKNIPVDSVTSWLDVLNTEGKVCSSDISTLPPALSEILIPQGIQSILTLPLSDNKAIVDYISFSCSQKKECPNTVELLESLVPIISTVKNRRQEHSSLHQREKVLSETLSEKEYQMVKFGLIAKASQVGQWDMLPVKDDLFNSNNVFMFSDKFRHMLGYSEEDFPNVFRSLLDITHPDDKVRMVNALRNHLLDTTGQTPFNDEHRLLKKNGEYGYFQAYGESVRDKDGNAIQTVGALKDITKEKEYLLEIQESEKKIKEKVHWYEFLLDAFYNTPISVTDMKKNVTFLNKAALDIVGKTREEVVGKYCGDVWGVDICKDKRCGIEHLKACKGKSIFHVGDSLYTTLASYIKDRDGNLIGHVEVVEDITEVTKIAKEKQSQLLKLDMALKASNVGLWDMLVVKEDPVNPKNPFFWSDEFRHMLGFTNEKDFPNMLGSWSDRLHPEDKERTLDAFAKHLTDTSGQTPYDLEYRLLKNNGEYGYFQAFGASIRDNDGHAIQTAGALKDITIRKKNEAELIRAKERAEESDRLKSAFLANMSHEIRTPLNAIMGFSNLLVTKNYSDEKRKMFLADIQNNSNQLLTIISDILDISKIESEQLELSYTWINLNQLMQSVNDTLQFQIKNSNKDISLFCQKPLPDVQAQIYVDDVRLKQVFINLISNAIKFTNQGFVHFGYTVRADNMLEFFVKDTGVGIAADKRAAVFERFRQEDETISRRFGGSGLGLPISKNLVELMGGKIWFESEKDKGSQFFFEIPYIAQKNDAISNEKIRNANVENIDSIARLFNGEKILVIDDHEPSYVLVSETLSNYDITVVHECSGRDGIAHVENDPDVALILMDIHMPALNGVETMKIIKEKYPHIPIVAQTAFALKGDQKKFLTAGFDDYAAKPLKNEDLVRVFKRYFNNKN